MAKITFKNKNISLEVEEGTTLAASIRSAGLSLETPCNCIGICGKCKVKVVGTLYPPTEAEEKFLRTADENIRLACLAKILGDVEIELFEERKEIKTINRGYAVETVVDSSIKRELLPEIKPKETTPYLETLPYKIYSVKLYENLGELEKENLKELYGIIYGNQLLDISKEKEPLLGIAVDIGTTGVSAYVINLETGEILNKASCLNPQTQYGGDVLSRISYCIEEEKGTETLKEAIIRGINDLIQKLLNNKWSSNQLYHMVIAANTTMLHLFLGVYPASIAKAPYRAVFLDKTDASPAELDINMNKQGIITLLPSASAYVGADILAGVMAVEFHKKPYASVFVDIGTNGEIVVIKDGNLVATSTAAGPALEGMNISCGCRAEGGAIDSLIIDEDYKITYTTIDGEPAKGICGSGLIDIAAALVSKNIILKNGRFNSNLPESLKERLRDKKFYITDDIYISQKDIRQIQLAKGAIATGITVLLSEAYIEISEIKEIIIAGAFGYHINPASIIEIGLIPKGYTGGITFVGNSSLEGARLSMISKSKLEEVVELKKKVQVVELSTREDFQNYFIKELNF